MINNFYNLDNKEDYIMMKDEFDGIEIRMISDNSDLIVFKKVSYEKAKEYRDFLDRIIKKHES